MKAIPKFSGSGASLYMALVASTMILGVAAMQVTKSYDNAMVVAFKGVQGRGRSVAKLTDSAIWAVDLVVSALAEDVDRGLGAVDPQDTLDRRLKQLDQVSALIVVQSGERWAAQLALPSPWASVESRSLAWHRSHPADGTAHIETISGSSYPSGIAIVLSRALRRSDGAVSGVVAAVLRPSFFETLYGNMIVGPQGAILLWRDDGHALLRYPPAPGAIGRDLSSASLFAAFRGPEIGSYRIKRSVVDGKDRLIDYRQLERFPILVVATSSSVEDVFEPWLKSELIAVSLVLLCVAILIALGIVTASDRRRQSIAEGLRRTDEALFRGVFDHSTDCLFVYRLTSDGTFIVEAINPAAVMKAGRSRDEILGHPATKVLPERIANRAVADLNATIAADKVVRFESEGESGGRKFFNEVVQVPLRNADGVCDRVFVGARDVTHLKTADERLSELNSRLVLAEQIAHVGHWRLELPSQEIFWSDEIYRIYGLEPTAPIPCLDKAIEAYHVDDRTEVARHLSEALAEKRGYEFSLRLVRPNGEIRHVTSRGLLEFRSDGEISAVFGALIDVTDLRQAERRLEEQSVLLRRSKDLAEKAHAEAERASAAKTDFLASMSHEIRTPLSGVLGYTELLLEDEELKEPQRKNVERIQNAGTALLTVVNDILDFSKIEAGQIDLEPRPFSLAGMIDNALSIVRSSADRKGLTVVIEIDPTISPWLLGDQDRLRQILLNLLNNAVKFTATGRITVAARAEQDDIVRLSVTDTGIGIPCDKREHLFERFSQVDNSIARRFGGTGLGLAICKSLVTLMGGTIGVESSDGGGSTFWLAIPFESSSASDKKEIETVSEPTSIRALTILLVDDLEVNRDLGRAMLANAGHNVDLAEDGTAAIAAVQLRAYDLVLMDVQMPGMDGLTATQRIRALPGPARSVPIVAMTANILPDQVSQCRTAGMDGHVGKPIRRSELNAAIERYGFGSDILKSNDRSAEGSFDKEAFDDLLLLIGPKSMNDLLGKLAAHLRSVLDTGISQATDPSELSRESHKINSMAGTMGFVGLSSLCADLERGCLNRTSRERLVPLLREAGSKTIEQIERLRAV